MSILVVLAIAVLFEAVAAVFAVRLLLNRGLRVAAFVFAAAVAVLGGLQISVM